MPRRRHRTGETARTLAELAGRKVNFVQPPPTELDRAHGWHVDTLRTPLRPEPPGPPLPGGPWEVACRLVRDYEFTEPGILRAVYRSGHDLLGRDMLLQGRFYGLRFHMGVRVTAVTDSTGPEERVWGWSYRTLAGHLEEGELSYDVVKDVTTGRVEFVISGYSRMARIPNPVIRLGFRVFGRWTQVRFYRRSGQRLRTMVDATLAGRLSLTPRVTADGLVLAPTTTTVDPIERLAPRSTHPGAD